MRILAPLVTLLRWFRAPQLGRFERQNHLGYWKLKRWLLTQLFDLRVRVFNSRTGAGELKHKTNILRELISALKYQLAGSILFAAGLLIVDHYLELILPLEWRLTLHPDALLALLSTLAQVSATMLGLYFTAVSVVASTAYARVAGEVRALIVADQASSFYFGFLARFCVLSLLFLLAVALGWKMGFLSLTVLAFFAVFGVISFITLGLRTFSFFDPGSLVESLNRPLFRCFNQVTPRGFAWSEPSFQATHYRHARHLLTCYENLVVMAEQKENLNTRALLALGNGLLEMLEIYPSFKSQIPSKSHWFQRRYRHKDWLTTSYSEVEIARATDTALNPEEIADPLWFERDTGHLLARILKSLLERSEFAAANSLLTRVQSLLGIWGHHLQMPEALDLLTSFQQVLRVHFRTSTFVAAPLSELEKSTQRFSLYDLLSLGLINSLLGWAEYCRNHTAADAIAEVENINWGRLSTQYPQGIRPRAVVEQWEALQGKVSFELEVEGHIVSPSWLFTEAAALGYCRYFTCASDLLAAHELWFRETVKERIAANDPVGAAYLGLRALEAMNKLRAHLPTLAEWHAQSAAFNRSQDEPWPEIDWKKINERAEQLRKDVTSDLIELTSAVIALPDEKNLPDLFGQIYTVLAERCLEAIIDEDRETFRKLFPTVFSTALRAYQRIFTRHESNPSHAFRLAMGPLGDLLALSGFALVSGDLVHVDFTKIATQAWDKFLESRTDDAHRRTVIAQFVASTDIMLGFSPRAMLRFEWKRKYNTYLEGKGFAVGRGFYYGEVPDRSHPSPLVRCYVMRASMYEADDLFVAAYISRRPEAAGLEMPAKVDSLAQSLEREAKRKNGAEAEEPEDE